MKKSDLENRLVVELKNGDRYIVIEDTMIGKTDLLDLCEYDEKLCHTHPNLKESEPLKIMKVFGMAHTLNDIDFASEKLCIWWKRPWEPSYGEDYYVADPTDVGLYNVFPWEGNPADRNWLEKGLVFKTREEAIELAEKMLEVAKQNK